ncbi:MAG: methyltransferase domain-containing protein [Calditrichia bacterium]|nr:methyltransferase domain-containing protein [Calditrichia bacterium]
MSLFIKEIIVKHDLKKILEIGSGANPTIDVSIVRDLNLDYTTSDIEEEELNKTDEIYNKVILDLSSGKVDLTEKYDLIFSRMVGEHISNGEVFHKNIYKLLNPDGLSIHCFSTLYALPFLFNRFMPEGLSDILLSKFAPRDEDKHGKFKAYYSWSRGPSQKMVKRYTDIGYEIVEYNGFFGHDYYKKIFPLNKLERFKMNWLVKHPIAALTSYACIILKKL